MRPSGDGKRLGQAREVRDAFVPSTKKALSASVETNGREALQALRLGTVQAEVILLDINMPVMNGFDVLRELKRDPQLMTLPVVMLSTSSNKGDVDMAYTLHASSYFEKSTDFDGFIAQIDAFLAYWRQAQLAPKPV
ncbi:response regulator [Deinococcus hopiensis]|uniref:Response regulator containing a CheY-like receiver domain and an HTH DNA-binding domain n=1 Tax=Deinococcus hopiensis KR-140 TaxID=695939 RepID=A0A1W1UW82_9DEIO|nr:response regulator [Deinococcus hopiensis]SMB85425.1 Response regulator containing a CheY-like receiver domain and an HTH DNA-binding domain [Deinococcus hopiensis KR-140]